MTKTVAMIPARKGSQRLPYKNLALIAGEPMISYVISSAEKSGVFDKVIVNSDAAVFEEVATDYGVEFYHRPSRLGSSDTKADDVVHDFITAHQCDVVAWVNPIAPLQPSGEIRNVVEYFFDNDLGSLFTVKREQVHCVHDGNTVNFSFDGKFAKTQSLTPVYPFIYSIMMWDVESFENEYRDCGYGLFCGETAFYPVSKESTFIVKYASDLKMVDAVMRGRRDQTEDVEYDQRVQELE
jgi:CMP-N-acetylneuraminic acid synthetase